MGRWTPAGGSTGRSGGKAGEGENRCEEGGGTFCSHPSLEICRSATVIILRAGDAFWLSAALAAAEPFCALLCPDANRITVLDGCTT